MSNRTSLLPVILLIIPVLTACSRADSEGDEAASALSSDVLTFEFAIEDDSIEGEFQLVSPRDICVDAGGNIYLADEHSLKVFRSDGTPLQQIGREGAGPGEFVGARSVDVGPTGYIAAVDFRWDANIYAPDGEYLDRYRSQIDGSSREYIQGKGFTFSTLNEVVALDPEHLLIDLEAMDNTLPGPYAGTAQLLYMTADTLFEVCHYIDHATVKTGPSQTRGVYLQGSLLWCLVDTGRILFTETGTDRVEAGPDSRYQLYVHDLVTHSTDTLAVPWIPEPLPREIRHADSLYVAILDRYYAIEPVVQEIMAGTEYYPPLKAVRADRGLIFGFHYSATDSVIRVRVDEVEVEPHLADIIDQATGQLLGRAEFPFLPEVIRDGRAYRLFTPSDGYPTVRVYRIDPGIYALRDE